MRRLKSWTRGWWHDDHEEPTSHYEEELGLFVKLMQRELNRNAAKGEWRGSPSDALHEISHHYVKLAESLRTNGGNVGELAADVANCAMFLAVAANALEESEQASYY